MGKLRRADEGDRTGLVRDRNFLGGRVSFRRRVSGGFTLLEALAALAIAAICLGVLTRGFIAARASAGIGETTLRGMMVARILATEWRDNRLTARSGVRDGFRYQINIRSVRLRTLPSAFPPIPQSSQQDANERQPPPPDAGNGSPRLPVDDKGKPIINRLQAVIQLTAPNGRTLHYATIKLETPH